jgi:transglutaminase/protease-like cytokinesis protein 3
MVSRKSILWGMIKLFFVALFFIANSGLLCAQTSDIRQLDYSSSDSVAAKYAGHSVENLALLSYQLTQNLPNDALKFRAIFKWVCDNIENDYELFTENQRNRNKINDPEQLKQWNATMQKRMYATLLKRRSTVCTGYAYLIKELCQFAGITAEIVDGYGRTVRANIGGKGIMNHSWTAVRLNNKWYLCDATWASGVIDVAQKHFVRKYDDAYFLSEPQYFIRNHYPADVRWTLLEKNPSLATFLNRPIVYNNAYKHQVLPHYPDVFEITPADTTLQFQVINESGREFQVSLRVNDEFTKRVSHTRADENICTIEFSPRRRSTYLVHVMVNGDAVFTYRVSKNRSAKDNNYSKSVD